MKHIKHYKRKARQVQTSVFGQMNRGMLGMAAGGMITGGGLVALHKMGAPASAGSGLSAASEMMGPMGAAMGGVGVIGMASQLMPKMPRMKKKKGGMF